MNSQICPNCGKIDPEATCLESDPIVVDTEHVRMADGRCVVSFNGQGHTPCRRPEHQKPVPPCGDHCPGDCGWKHDDPEDPCNVDLLLDPLANDPARGDGLYYDG